MEHLPIGAAANAQGAASQPGPEHLAALAEGRKRAKKVRRAVSVARAHAGLLAVCAAITLMFALFGDWVALLLGVGLGAVAANEFYGAKQLTDFDVRGAIRLGYNQIVFGSLIVAYAGWSLWSATHAVETAESPQLKQLLADPQFAGIGELTTSLTYLVYGGVAVLGIVEPGLLAWYYFSRAPMVRALKEQTPRWVLDAMRAMG